MQTFLRFSYKKFSILLFRAVLLLCVSSVSLGGMYGN